MKARIVIVTVLIALLLPLVLTASVSAAPASAGSGILYTVRRGDTLTAIARRFGVTINAIVLANGLVNPNRIFAGQRLLIPTGIGPACNYRVYTVQRGDTLSAISRRFGISLFSLIQANRLISPNLIFVGQRLVLPRSGITITAPASGSTINGSVHVSGEGSAFENTLAVEVRTASGGVLVRGVAMITGVDMGQTGPYAADLSFTPPATSQPGRVVVFATSPRDGSVVDQACVDVTLQGGS